MAHTNKPRWRIIKQHKTQDLQPTQVKAKFFLGERIIAFITDMFMINMPILYITYFILGSKEAFLGNQIAIFICVILFGIILSVFIAFNGQTPGYRYVGLKLVSDEDSKIKISFGIAFVRYILWIISISTIIGLCIAFFRNDRKTFYDLICHTKLIKIESKIKS